MGNAFTLSQLSQMTMLTDRTLRNYLKRGLLKGERTAAGWRFSAEEVVRFLNEPFVKAAVDTKEAATALDFLQRRIPTQGQMCVLWHCGVSTEEDAARLCRGLLDAVEHRPDLTFVYRREGNLARVTLRGTPEDVWAVLSNFSPAGSL